MAIINDETKRLDLPKPNASNFLQDDVERLREALEDIGDKVATIAADGKLDPTQIPDSVVQWDANQIIDASHMPGTVVQSDANGKIPLDKIPQGALVTRFSVSTEAAMLALAAIPGDICRRTDIPAYFLLMDTPATNRDAWRRLHEDGFYDQFASKSDPLAGVKGPLALKAEGVGDYDAATIKQLKAVSNSGNAATMSGVMNNFIGAVEWFNGSRLSLPAGYIAADGQEESQTDPLTADLYTAVKNDLFVTVDESVWLADPVTQGGFALTQRACYVKQSTTPGKFRVPDLNGVQKNSIQGVFLRGSTPAWTNGPGYLASDQLKDHTHILYFNVATTRNEIPSAQALRGGGVLKKLPIAPDNSYDTSLDDYSYSASEKYVAGRTTVPYENTVVSSVSETTPRAAVGIWIIRANGAFNAANTAFNVINKDTTTPASSTTVSGGKLISSYYIGNVETYRTRLYSQGDFAVSHLAVLAVENMNPDGTVTPGNAAYYTFNSNGEFKVPGVVNCNGLTMIGRAAGSPTIILSEMDNTSVGIAMRRTNTGTAGPRNIVSLRQSSTNPGDMSKAYLNVDGGFICRRGINAAASNPDNAFNFNWTTSSMEVWIDSSNVFNINGNGVVAVTSDRALKFDIHYPSATRSALDEVLAWRPANFGFKPRGVIPASRGHLGFIANDLVRVSPECVSGTGLPEDADLEKVQLKDAYHLDTTAMLAKMTLAFKALEERLRILEARA
ncbi:tail fiber domain-containing protein [Escherichia coli]